MKTSPRGIGFIKAVEGFRAEVYRDAAGKETIGVGHLVKSGERFDAPITEDEADVILARDLEEAEAGVERLINVPLTQGQFDALVSFVFNLGAERLRASVVLRFINEQRHLFVPAELLRWIHAGGRALKGLALRRLGEATMYLEGTKE